MLSKSLLLVALAVIGATSSTPVELEARDCKKKDYGPFRLYAVPKTGGDSYQVSLIPIETFAPTDPTSSTLAVCSDPSGCGITPDYWNLKSMVLTGTVNSASAASKTYNAPVVKDDTVKFYTSSNATVIARTVSPIYCAVRDPTKSNGLPGFLSVNGSPEEFSMCTNFPTIGTPAVQYIYYKANTTTGLEKFCTPIHLVMQSTGIIAEPIPA